MVSAMARASLLRIIVFCNTYSSAVADKSVVRKRLSKQIRYVQTGFNVCNSNNIFFDEFTNKHVTNVNVSCTVVENSVSSNKLSSDVISCNDSSIDRSNNRIV